MAFCLAELHCWSSSRSLQVRDTDIGTYQYYDKGEPAIPSEHHYYTDKQYFSESRGYSWTPRNRRPEKLRDSLEKLEVTAPRVGTLGVFPFRNARLINK
ncbi:WD repeat-containing and planar cell polarity effector protein fritz homolog isoform X1 [Salmo trutta]|uniref:WD repeat-containing and planar cell polarity effector protein fritz homolog isoform X1 n=1 Tax=Salmo trutta TaxID=8032 RepID=UPI001131B9B0|nr:WD repeat-containing and planar cell polarity effector protein fritz homolog isoform X1 [Salmo trutta]